MTYSYQYDNKTYQVGEWLPHDGSARFVSVIEVEGLRNAMRLVNYLNGGDGTANGSLFSKVLGKDEDGA